MASQLDLDQGGTFRQKQRLYLGPSVGWQEAINTGILNVTSAGTVNVTLGTNLVLVNVAGLVTVNLPSAKQSPAGAQALPGTFLGIPITVVDIGGNAQNNNITIAAAGAETIDGFASITIQINFGAYVLLPNLTSGGYTLTQS
jgi:hypothetical protein